MRQIRKILRYTIRGILILIVALLARGAIQFDGTIAQYFTFLNQRDRQSVSHTMSWKRPGSIAHIFLASSGEHQIPMTGGALRTGQFDPDTLSDQEIDSFFADFAQQLEQDSDSSFGFTASGQLVISGSQTGQGIPSQGFTEQEKQQFLLLLQNRKQRLDTQAQAQSDMSASGDIEEADPEVNY